MSTSQVTVQKWNLDLRLVVKSVEMLKVYAVEFEGQGQEYQVQNI
jgi:hypothetical protein